MASLCALRGESADALRYLADCVAARPALTRVRARVDPDFDTLREDPAFRALVDGDAVVGRSRTADTPASVICCSPPRSGRRGDAISQGVLVDVQDLQFTAALVLASAVAYAQAPPPAPAAAPAMQGPPPQPALGPNQWRIDTAHSNAAFLVTHLMVSTG